MKLHVLPNLEFVAIIFFSFDLWMSKGGVDTFALVINYLDDIWKPRHAIVGFFKVHGTIGSAMALQLESLLRKIDLIQYVIAFVKDEGNNLKIVAAILKFIIECELVKFF
jgi:hypothetical protein